MGKYVNEHLNRNEEIVNTAVLSKAFIIWPVIYGFFGAPLLFIPTIIAIVRIIRFLCTELAITDKRIIGKVGIINTKSLDAPLNKIQNVSAESGLIGKILNFGTIKIMTASGTFNYPGVKEADVFKNRVLDQIDQYENDKIKAQAAEMAKAMSNTAQ